MTDDGRYPFEEGRAHLNWKTRKGSPDSSSKPAEYGSFYTIIPKGQVRQLGWGAQQELRTRIEDGRLVISAAEPNGGRARPTARTEPPLDTFLRGDVLDQLAQIPDKSVHMTITSPPYNVGIDYQAHDDALEYGTYRRWLKEVWRELFRVTVRGGRFALNTAPTGISNYHPIQIDLTNDARQVGFEFRTEIIWYKQNMTAKRTAWGSFRRPSHPHIIPSWEYVDVLQKDSPVLEGRKQDATISSKEFVQWSDGLWVIPPVSGGPLDHPAPFPEELIERLIKFYTFRGNVVLDPFGGSGTVAAVAHQLDRRFIYVDNSEEYTRDARNRVLGNPKQRQLDGPKSRGKPHFVSNRSC
jgi:DNA modification methylase